jgi:serine-type D-Ala-D-Ala carboxypeptidase/endopeptidase (penicillin-binding protein 4)
MKRLLYATFFFTAHSWANSGALNAEFKNLLSQSKLGSLTEQSYCYSENGVTKGYQPFKMQRIASVTKLLSTYLASETLDLNQSYRTTIYVGKDSLHIDGNLDPYFEEEKLLLLFKALNDLGHISFKKVTFTKDFLFYDQALNSFEKVTPEKTRLRLLSYLSSKNKRMTRRLWPLVRKFAEEEGILLDEKAPELSAQSVQISEANPLVNESYQTFIHDSKPLHALLKAMNVQSKNLLAENVFMAGSRIKKFDVLMTEKGIRPDTYRIYNGSGLPIENNQSRIDNLATCDMVLKVSGLLSLSLKKHNLVITDVVAVNGGKDLGSFRNRFKEYPETHEAVISKTGTLKHTSSLAGFLLVNGEIPFAILNHTTSAGEARKFQDRFVSRMFDYLGAPTPVAYEKIPIFPWDGSEFLKPLL